MTAPNTTMAVALTSAGVKPLPLARRIWTMVKDHPGDTADQIAARLCVKPQRVRTALHDMCARKMVTARRERNRHTGHLKAHWSTTMQAFEWLPRPKAEVGPTPLPASVTAPPPASPRTQDSPHTTGIPDVDTLTIAQARVLYVKLKAFFGDPT